MKQIIDATTLFPEQRKHLLKTFSSLDLLLSIFHECNPSWIPIIQVGTKEFLDDILSRPEEEQLKALQEYLTIDDE